MFEIAGGKDGFNDINNQIWGFQNTAERTSLIPPVIN